MTNRKLRLEAEDAYATDASVRHTPKIMGEAELNILYLPRPSFALKLFINLINHTNARSTNRVTKTLKAPISLARNSPV